MIIYKTTNLINGKIYVGQTITDDPHYYGSGMMILWSIKKYGKENFKREILEECNDRNELNERERYWIKQLNSTNKDIGYNISMGGEQGPNFEYTGSWSEKQSNNKKGLWNNPDSVYHSYEYRKSVSDGVKRSREDPEFRKLMDEIHSSKEWSEIQSELKKHLWEQKDSPYRTKEYKESVSKGVKSLWKDSNSVYNTEEFRKKFFYERTEQNRKDTSKRMKSYWDNLSEEERQERQRKSKEFWNSPEGKKIKSKAYYKGRSNR